MSATYLSIGRICSCSKLWLLSISSSRCYLHPIGSYRPRGPHSTTFDFILRVVRYALPAAPYAGYCILSFAPTSNYLGSPPSTITSLDPASPKPTAGSPADNEQTCPPYYTKARATVTCDGFTQLGACDASVSALLLPC